MNSHVVFRNEGYGGIVGKFVLLFVIVGKFVLSIMIVGKFVLCPLRD